MRMRQLPNDGVSTPAFRIHGRRQLAALSAELGDGYAFGSLFGSSGLWQHGISVGSFRGHSADSGHGQRDGILHFHVATATVETLREFVFWLAWDAVCGTDVCRRVAVPLAM